MCPHMLSCKYGMFVMGRHNTLIYDNPLSFKSIRRLSWPVLKPENLIGIGFGINCFLKYLPKPWALIMSREHEWQPQRVVNQVQYESWWREGVVEGELKNMRSFLDSPPWHYETCIEHGMPWGYQGRQNPQLVSKSWACPDNTLTLDVLIARVASNMLAPTNGHIPIVSTDPKSYLWLIFFLSSKPRRNGNASPVNVHSRSAHPHETQIIHLPDWNHVKKTLNNIVHPPCLERRPSY